MIESIRDKCNESDIEIIKKFGLLTYEDLEEMLEGFKGGMSEAICDEDEECDILNTLLLDDDYKSMVYALWVLGLSSECAKKIASLFFYDMLPHREPGELELDEE